MGDRAVAGSTDSRKSTPAVSARVMGGVLRAGGTRASAITALAAPQPQGRCSLTAHSKPGPDVADRYQWTSPSPVMAADCQASDACTRSSSNQPKPMNARSRLPFRQWATVEGAGIATPPDQPK